MSLTEQDGCGLLLDRRSTAILVWCSAGNRGPRNVTPARVILLLFTACSRGSTISNHMPNIPRKRACVFFWFIEFSFPTSYTYHIFTIPITTLLIDLYQSLSGAILSILFPFLDSVDRILDIHLSLIFFSPLTWFVYRVSHVLLSSLKCILLNHNWIIPRYTLTFP